MWVVSLQPVRAGRPVQSEWRADGGQFDGTGPDQAGPEKDGKPLHSAGGLARPDGPVWSDQSSSAATTPFPWAPSSISFPKHGFDWAPNSCFRRLGVAVLSRERERQKGNRFQSLKHPARHPSNEWWALGTASSDLFHCVYAL